MAAVAAVSASILPYISVGINPHNTVWGQFNPIGLFPCTALKPPASQF